MFKFVASSKGICVFLAFCTFVLMFFFCTGNVFERAYFYYAYTLPTVKPLRVNFSTISSQAKQLPCADTYNGGAAFSEIETSNVRDAVLSVANQNIVYLTFH